MKPFQIHYSKLNSDSDVQILEFDKLSDRRDATSMFKELQDNKKVFIVAIETDIVIDETEDDVCIAVKDFVFVDHKLTDIINMINHTLVAHHRMFIFECSSYEDAYIQALDMREIYPNCYEDS
jgi:hypothetical protein